MPRDAADKLIFEQEAKEKAAKEAKIAEEKAEKEKAKKGKVFAHLSGGGGSSSSTAKPPAPPASESEKSAASGVQERCAVRGGGACTRGITQLWLLVAAVTVVVDATINRCPMVSWCIVAVRRGGWGVGKCQAGLGEAGRLFWLL